MAGQKGQRSGGHNAKTTAQHIEDGTYQAIRHSSRADAEVAIGNPQKPAGLDDIESSLWDDLTDFLPDGCLGGADTVALREMCQWYGVYRKSMQSFSDDPLDKDARMATCATWDRFWRIAQDFGATPVARARLQIGGDSGASEGNEPVDRYASIMQHRDAS